MSKVEVSRKTLLGFAQKCARVSDTRKGDPFMDVLADLLEAASFRVAELEDRLDDWERFGDNVREHLPAVKR